MGCQGKCTITKSESRNLRLGKFTKSNDSCPNLSKTVATRVINTYLAPILADAPSGCGPVKDPPECVCEELPDQDPAWGPWRPYAKKIPFRAQVGRLTCDYVIGFKVEIRKRVFDGVCYLVQLPTVAVDQFGKDVLMIACDRISLPDQTLLEEIDFDAKKSSKKG